MDITQFFSEDSVVWHIVEFLAPFLILIITLHDERKQTAKYKRQEIKLQYLKECISWLSELEMLAYIVSDKAAECVYTFDTEKFITNHREFNREANAMMEKCLAGIGTYSSVSKALCIEFDPEEIRHLTGKFMSNLRETCKESCGEQEGQQVKKINSSTTAFQKEIRNKISLVGENVSKLFFHVAEQFVDVSFNK